LNACRSYIITKYSRNIKNEKIYDFNKISNIIPKLRESLQAISQLRVAVAEAGDSLGTQTKGKVRLWKPLSSNGSEDHD
jgi:hypothetical protein